MAGAFLTSLAAALLMFAGLVTGAAPHARAQEAAKPRRIVSLNLCSDQLVVLLAEREAIASVTFLAADPVRSYVADQVQGLRLNHGLAEEIVSLQPDLVFAGPFAARATVGMLRGLDIRVVVLPLPASFDDIREQIAFVADILGERERGHRAIAAMDARLASARRDRADEPRVAAIFGPNGFTSGPGTLPHAVLEAAGLTNLAEQMGFRAIGQFSVEDVVRGHPDTVVLNTDAAAAPSLARDLLNHPALAKLRLDIETIFVPPKLWECGGPYSAEAVSLLTRTRP